jgi:hypothetical protein
MSVSFFCFELPFLPASYLTLIYLAAYLTFHRQPPAIAKIRGYENIIPRRMKSGMDGTLGNMDKITVGRILETPDVDSQTVSTSALLCSHLTSAMAGGFQCAPPKSMSSAYQKRLSIPSLNCFLYDQMLDCSYPLTSR